MIALMGGQECCDEVHDRVRGAAAGEVMRCPVCRTDVLERVRSLTLLIIGGFWSLRMSFLTSGERCRLKYSGRKRDRPCSSNCARYKFT